MERRRTRWASGQAALVGVLVGLVSCTPAPVDPPVTPAPTAIPTATATPTESALQRQRRLDFEAAKTTYRAVFDELNKLVLAGSGTPSTRFTSLTAGPYQEEQTEGLKGLAELGYRGVGAGRLISLRDDAYSESELNLVKCEDGTRSRIVDAKGKTIARGSIRTATVILRKSGQSWKVWSEGKAEDGRCD